MLQRHQNAVILYCWIFGSDSPEFRLESNTDSTLWCVPDRPVMCRWDQERHGALGRGRGNATCVVGLHPRGGPDMLGELSILESAVAAKPVTGSARRV